MSEAVSTQDKPGLLARGIDAVSRQVSNAETLVLSLGDSRYRQAYQALGGELDTKNVPALKFLQGTSRQSNPTSLQQTYELIAAYDSLRDAPSDLLASYAKTERQHGKDTLRQLDTLIEINKKIAGSSPIVPIKEDLQDLRRLRDQLSRIMDIQKEFIEAGDLRSAATMNAAMPAVSGNWIGELRHYAPQAIEAGNKLLAAKDPRAQTGQLAAFSFFSRMFELSHAEEAQIAHAGAEVALEYVGARLALYAAGALAATALVRAHPDILKPLQGIAESARTADLLAAAHAARRAPFPVLFSATPAAALPSDDDGIVFTKIEPSAPPGGPPDPPNGPGRDWLKIAALAAAGGTFANIVEQNLRSSTERGGNDQIRAGVGSAAQTANRTLSPSISEGLEKADQSLQVRDAAVQKQDAEGDKTREKNLTNASNIYQTDLRWLAILEGINKPMVLGVTRDLFVALIEEEISSKMPASVPVVTLQDGIRHEAKLDNVKRDVLFVNEGERPKLFLVESMLDRPTFDSARTLSASEIAEKRKLVEELKSFNIEASIRDAKEQANVLNRAAGGQIYK